jgi:hypothetical protein
MMSRFITVLLVNKIIFQSFIRAVALPGFAYGGGWTREARPARPEAPTAPEAVLGAGPGGGRPSRKGVRGYHPRENFRNLTNLMCILETENFTFVLHVHS